MPQSCGQVGSLSPPRPEKTTGLVEIQPPQEVVRTKPSASFSARPPHSSSPLLKKTRPQAVERLHSAIVLSRRYSLQRNAR